MTGKTTLIALSAAVALGVAGASVAQASDNNSGDYHGGFKIGPLGQVMGSPHGRSLGSSYAPRSDRQLYDDAEFAYPNGSGVYAYANGGRAYSYPDGEFINGNFIPRGTSTAQVPSYRAED